MWRRIELRWRTHARCVERDEGRAARAIWLPSERVRPTFYERVPATCSPQEDSSALEHVQGMYTRAKRVCAYRQSGFVYTRY